MLILKTLIIPYQSLLWHPAIPLVQLAFALKKKKANMTDYHWSAHITCSSVGRSIGRSVHRSVRLTFSSLYATQTLLWSFERLSNLLWAAASYARKIIPGIRRWVARCNSSVMVIPWSATLLGIHLMSFCLFPKQDLLIHW